MTPEREAQIEARCNAATDGPWATVRELRAEVERLTTRSVPTLHRRTPDGLIRVEWHDENSRTVAVSREFIDWFVASHNALAAKIARVEALCDAWDIPYPDAGVAWAAEQVRAALRGETP